MTMAQDHDDADDEDQPEPWPNAGYFSCAV